MFSPWKLFLCALLLPLGSLFAVVSDYQPLTDQQMSQYLQSLQGEIRLQEQRINNIMRDVANGQYVSTVVDNVRIRTASAVLQVKQTLYSNFVGTQSLRSPFVRQQLLNLMKKDEITTSDLAAFQSLVEQEKANIRESMQPQTQQQQRPLQAPNWASAKV